jgi:hypothetical protein
MPGGHGTRVPGRAGRTAHTSRSVDNRGYGGGSPPPGVLLPDAGYRGGDGTTSRTEGEAEMAHDLQGQKIAILAADGVERIELEEPRGALHGAGATTELLSIHPGELKARQFDIMEAGTFPVDRLVSDA